MKAELSQANLELKTRDFFSDPFTREEIEKLFGMQHPSEFFSYLSPSFKKLELDSNYLTRDEMIDLMFAEPRLIKRPLVLYDGNVFLGTDRDRLVRLLEYSG